MAAQIRQQNGITQYLEPSLSDEYGYPQHQNYGRQFHRR